MVRTKSGLFDSMRPLYAFATLTAIAALSAAAAQSYSDNVTVNPHGTRVLIDPGTGQTRVMGALLMPGEEAEPIRLRPPRQSRRAPPQTPPPAVASAPPPAPRVASAPPPARTYTPPPPPAEPPPVAEPPRPRVAKAAPPPQVTPRATPAPQPAPAPQAAPARQEEDFTDLATAQPAPPPRRPAAKATPPVDFDTSLPPRKAATAKPPVDFDASLPPRPAKQPEPVFTASIDKPKPTRTHTPYGTALGSIDFAPNASDPTTSAVNAVRALAVKLNSALSSGAERVEIKAYAGDRGEKTSETRRMSLKRALVVRQLLIDDGVPAERIKVFALGGVDDSGPTERVDVLLKS